MDIKAVVLQKVRKMNIEIHKDKGFSLLNSIYIVFKVPAVQRSLIYEQEVSKSCLNTIMLSDTSHVQCPMSRLSEELIICKWRHQLPDKMSPYAVPD